MLLIIAGLMLYAVALFIAPSGAISIALAFAAGALVGLGIVRLVLKSRQAYRAYRRSLEEEEIDAAVKRICDAASEFGGKVIYISEEG